MYGPPPGSHYFRIPASGPFRIYFWFGSMTRRELIWRVASMGGYPAAFVLMRSMNLLSDPPQSSVPFRLPPESGKGEKIAILCAGIGGLVSALELRKAGFDCTVLEARDRPGGRNWSVRGGTKIEFTDGTVQHCTFDEGLYLNAGPGGFPRFTKPCSDTVASLACRWKWRSTFRVARC